MKRRKFAFAVIVFLLLTACTPKENAPASTPAGTPEIAMREMGGTAEVRVGEAPLRSEPFSNSALLRNLANGEIVKVIAQATTEDEWFEVVTSDNETGWVLGDFVELKEAADAETATGEPEETLQTEAPSETPTASLTATSTETPANSPTAQGTSTDEPLACTPLLTALGSVRVRNGPSEEYPNAGFLSVGDQVGIIGRGGLLNWWKIECGNFPGETECWVTNSTSYVQVSCTQDVAVVPAPPTPFPTWTPTPTSTSTSVPHTATPTPPPPPPTPSPTFCPGPPYCFDPIPPQRSDVLVAFALLTSGLLLGMVLVIGAPSRD